MPLTRASLERQLSEAKARRDACAERLQQKGIEESDLRRQPSWKHWHAKYRSLKRRLNAVTAKEQQAAELAAAKSSDGE